MTLSHSAGSAALNRRIRGAALWDSKTRSADRFRFTTRDGRQEKDDVRIGSR